MKAAAAKLVGNWNAVVALDDKKLEAMLKVADPASQTPAGMAKLRESLQSVKMVLTLRDDGTGETVVSGLGAQRLNR